MERSQKSSLAALFAGPGLVEVLALLLLHPDEEYYQREISRVTGLRLLQVQRALERMSDAGLVAERRKGNRAYYRAERGHPAFLDLQQVFLKTVGLVDRLGAALVPMSDRLEVAFVYGSLARAEEGADSDIDLIGIGAVTLRELAAALAPVAREAGRELNASVFSVEEFRDRYRTGHHLTVSVVEGRKLWLIGDQSELERLVG
jgi:DNA-binding transcriptional ArsR family regulator